MSDLLTEACSKREEGKIMVYAGSRRVYFTCRWAVSGLVCVDGEGGEATG